MTQKLSNQRPKIALFEPDIPQNTAAIIRTCACLGAKLEIIKPCGFLISDKRFKRVVMDYMNSDEIEFYESSDHFFKSKENQRIVLMTTKASISYTSFKFNKNDTDEKDQKEQEETAGRGDRAVRGAARQGAEHRGGVRKAGGRDAVHDAINVGGLSSTRGSCW